MTGILRPMAVLVSCSGVALAQSTSFTYQGELKQNASLASGTYDMGFRLFDGAAEIGYNCIDNVLVTDGKFVVRLDYANLISTSSQTTLQIQVRADTSTPCTDPAGYTVLTPRQIITPTPLAIHSFTCANASVAQHSFTSSLAAAANSLQPQDGSPINAVFVDSVGNIGVGTTTPTHTVHIASAQPTLAIQDTDSNGAALGQQVGYVSYRDSGNVERAWIGYGSAGDADFSIVNARPSGDIVLNPFSGNVGIGTAVPAARLDVRGDIRLGSGGESFAIKSPANDRILRGFVNANGTINASQSSAGFTITKTATGVYSINFNQPFASPPTLVVGAAAQCCKPRNNAVGATSAVVHVNSADSPFANVDSPFTFIIMGQ